MIILAVLGGMWCLCAAIIWKQNCLKVLAWMAGIIAGLVVLGGILWMWADIFATGGPIFGMLCVIALILICKH